MPNRGGPRDYAKAGYQVRRDLLQNNIPNATNTLEPNL